MKTRNFFVVKLIAVTLMLGFFSPSITIENIEAPSKIASETKIDLSQGLIAGLATTDISLSLFTQAEARRGKRRGARRGARRGHRKAHRRANYRHHKKKHRRRNAGRVIGGIAAGVAVGAAVSHASNRSRCETVYVRGLRYEDCGDGLRRY